MADGMKLQIVTPYGAVLRWRGYYGRADNHGRAILVFILTTFR